MPPPSPFDAHRYLSDLDCAIAPATSRAKGRRPRGLRWALIVLTLLAGTLAAPHLIA